MWKDESDEGKAFFIKLARQEKIQHGITYPDWKCQPRKSADIARRTNKMEVFRSRYQLDDVRGGMGAVNNGVKVE